MAKTKDGLDLNEDGMVILCPVVGWTAFVPAGLAVGIRLDYATGPDRLETSEGVQLVLTPAQARALAQVLQNAADRADRPPGSGASSH